MLVENNIISTNIGMVNLMIGLEEAKKLKIIPLSNDTILRRINKMATDIHQQIVRNLLSSEFYSIQFNESTDVINMTQFLYFVRCECGGSIKENMCYFENRYQVMHLNKDFLKYLLGQQK